MKVQSFCEDLEGDQIKKQWSSFKAIVQSTMDEIPSKSFSTRFNQPWFTRNCNRLSKKTKRLYNRAKRKNMSTDWERYSNAYKEYKIECKKAHDKYLNENVFNEQGDTKKLYAYIKSKKQDNV